MDLIFGGAYQGKLHYARERYALTDDEIFTCTAEAEPKREKRCIRHLEEYVLFCLRQETEPELSFRDDAVILARDLSCGVVPIDSEIRAWRELNGRTLNRLAVSCTHVVRLFCGLPQILK